MPFVVSVNAGRPRPLPGSRTPTGIRKTPVDSIEVTDPGPHGGRSGVRGDFIGNAKHHGGSLKAVYAVAREDLDFWSTRLERELPDGWMGENLTTRGIDWNAAVLGSRYRIGSATLAVSVPRIPCNTFNTVAGRPGWLKEFTRQGRAGSYLAVEQPGIIVAGDEIETLDVPPHGVGVQELFWAITIKPELASHVLTAGEVFLRPGDLEKLRRRARTTSAETSGSSFDRPVASG